MDIKAATPTAQAKTNYYYKQIKDLKIEGRRSKWKTQVEGNKIFWIKSTIQTTCDSLLLETPLIFHRDHEGTTPLRWEQEEEKVEERFLEQEEVTWGQRVPLRDGAGPASWRAATCQAPRKLQTGRHLAWSEWDWGTAENRGTDWKSSTISWYSPPHACILNTEH